MEHRVRHAEEASCLYIDFPPGSLCIYLETIPLRGQTDCAAFDQYPLASLPQPMPLDSASR